jgi:hypothetical protein
MINVAIIAVAILIARRFGGGSQEKVEGGSV